MRRMISQELAEWVSQMKDVISYESDMLTIDGDLTIDGLTSKGIANTGGFANIGNVAISGDFTASGDVKVFENITDESNNKRFIKGDIALKSDLTGVTLSYGKWSLSGSHLMIVMTFTVDDETVISNGAVWAELTNLPDWVIAKIYRTVSSIVLRQSLTLYGEDISTQSITMSLRKSDGGVVYINSTGLTLTADRSARLQFDLLID
jgi:hypothetical protein